MTIAIVDYGCGNLHSAAKAFERAVAENGAREEVRLTADPEVVRRAERVVLPGVGAFHECRTALANVPGREEALVDHVQRKGQPFLGICVGMQLLATRGLEHQVSDGLNWIPGEVARISPVPETLKIPHMGWNSLRFLQPHPVLDQFTGGEDGVHAYFVHSYAFRAENRDDVAAETDYGGTITAVVARGPVIGTQFHPEKSQKFGLLFLQSFLRWHP
ncbi:MAG: imidazole glycerol phosphate synthase subunit HisH [Methylobacteriaceae bacterium]|jgi:glutamine amidotransferase|nr:imidazole glycerol phosphate synthase subunit HisH [Methylobacteriaceae bacterium]